MGRNEWPVVMVLVGLMTLQVAAQERPARTLPEDVQLIGDIPYVSNGHERQKLDLYLPKQRPAGEQLLPVVVWVHGGAWLGGDKSNAPAAGLVRRGFAVASVGYRLSRHAKFPAQIHDCKAAVRWLRANAKGHGLDPERFGAWGPSAGGHLVSLLGTSGGVKELEGELGEHPGVSSRVQAVVDWFGPSDLTAMARQAPPNSRIDHDAANAPGALLIGGPVQENREKAAKANPIDYVSKDDPPFLIVHGTADDVVPFGQSEMFEKALKSAGVEVTFVPVEGAGHGGEKFNASGARGKAEEFFERVLKGPKRQ